MWTKNRLKAAQKEAKLKSGDLAVALGVAPVTVYSWRKATWPGDKVIPQKYWQELDQIFANAKKHDTEKATS